MPTSLARARLSGLAPLIVPLAVAIVLITLAIPLLKATPRGLTSDESLYVSEGLNIAEGHGFTYSTGEPVNHRGPIFPLLLAGDFAIGGFSLNHAYIVPKLVALASAATLLALTWRFFGKEAGLLAGALALASALLMLMGSTLFLDGTQSLFMLLALIVLYPAFKDERPWLAGLAGAFLGLAVLTKESALLWLPLPFFAALLHGPNLRRPASLLFAFALGFLAVAGWWWPYVYVITGQIYLLGDSASSIAWMSLSLGVVAAFAIAAVGLARTRPPLTRDVRFRWTFVVGLLLIWGSLFLVGLERNSGWDYPPHYATTVPAYMSDIMASWLRPLPLILAAWGYVAYRAYRGSLADRFLVLGLLLFLPFVLVVANRSLHIRDILPVVYLSYAALARSAVDFARWLARVAAEGSTPALGNTAAVLLVLAAFAWFAIDENRHVADATSAFHAEIVQQGNWDNPLAKETADWIRDHVPPGTPVMSSRLYSTSVYSLTGAQYPWWQLPTVRVNVDDPAGRLTRATTLFRWEDHLMPDGAGEPWLYLRRYPVKGYYIALSERDLIAGLHEHNIKYLVLAGDDAGFSSLNLLPYFNDNPYFELEASFVVDETNQTHIFRVLSGFTEPTNGPAVVSESTVSALEDELGAQRAQVLLRSLSPAGYTTGDALATAAWGGS